MRQGGVTAYDCRGPCYAKLLGCTISLVRVCKNCERILASDKRADAQFCGTKCKEEAQKAAKKARNIDRFAYEQAIPQRFAKWIREFEERVRQQAPEDAIGYQLGFTMNGMDFWFPIVKAGKARDGSPLTRRTFNRSRSLDYFFPLVPFEPPIVPLATRYQVRFVSRNYPHYPLPDSPSWTEAIPYEFKVLSPFERPDRLPKSRFKR